jgi:hypothetical protein
MRKREVFLLRVLRGVALRIRLYRAVRTFSRALLCAAPVAVAAAYFTGLWAPSLLPIATALPFLGALGLLVIRSRKKTGLAEAALYADLRLGLGGSLAAWATQIHFRPPSGMRRLVEKSLKNRLPPSAAALCRFPWPWTLAPLFAVPPALVAAAWISTIDSRPSPMPAHSVEALNVARTLRSWRSLPARGDDRAVEELRALWRALARGGKDGDLVRRANSASEAIGAYRRRVEGALHAARRALASHPALARDNRSQENPKARPIGRNAMTGPERNAAAAALDRTAEETSGFPDLSAALSALSDALSQGKGESGSLQRLLLEMKGLKALADRALQAQTRARGVAIGLGGGQGQDHPGASSAEPAPRGEGHPVRARTGTEVPILEKAYLKALDRPNWEPRFDRLVRDYLAALKEGK